MRNLLTYLFILFALVVDAQEFNRIDAEGRKQGPFKKYYESAKDRVFYTGQFKDDLPVGIFVYYYKNGEKKSVMNYEANGLVRSEVYSEAGDLIAKGNYVNREKDSLWIYMNEGQIKSIENWSKGKKNGLEAIFYNGRDTTEVKFWKEDQLHGPFKQYFLDGSLKMSTQMVQNAYEGETVFYHENGKLNMKGKYVSGYRNGSWYHYNKDGSLKMQVLYDGGDIVKEKRENGLFIEYFEPEMPQSEITYKNGLKHGPFVIYHEGAKRVVVDELDKATGEMIKKEIVEGVAPKMKGEYRNDQLHGNITHFNRAGKVVKTENFQNGTLVNK
ncbi:MAG: hypothetical protein AAF487_12555 [Bacteroidota bacterium]